jgi:hypothetical protein
MAAISVLAGALTSTREQRASAAQWSHQNYEQL